VDRQRRGRWISQSWSERYRSALIEDEVKDHTRAEAILRASALDWTTVRPVPLTDVPSIVELVPIDDSISPFLKVSRSSVAHWIIGHLEELRRLRLERLQAAVPRSFWSPFRSWASGTIAVTVIVIIVAFFTVSRTENKDNIPLRIDRHVFRMAIHHQLNFILCLPVFDVLA
jgi:hypothetical protein